MVHDLVREKVKQIVASRNEYQRLESFRFMSVACCRLHIGVEPEMLTNRGWAYGYSTPCGLPPLQARCGGNVIAVATKPKCLSASCLFVSGAYSGLKPVTKQKIRAKKKPTHYSLL